MSKQEQSWHICNIVYLNISKVYMIYRRGLHHLSKRSTLSINELSLLGISAFAFGIHTHGVTHVNRLFWKICIIYSLMILVADYGYNDTLMQVLYNWLIWRVLKLAFFFQKSIFPVFILASGAVRTTPSLCRHIFMRSLIWRWWVFAKKRQIKNHAKLTSYTVYSLMEPCRERFWNSMKYQIPLSN